MRGCPPWARGVVSLAVASAEVLDYQPDAPVTLAEMARLEIAPESDAVRRDLEALETQ